MEFKQRISKEVAKRKYFLYGEKNVKEICENVSKEIASVEKEKDKWEKKFFDIIFSGEFIPAGRILANARPFSKMKNYNNCFTIDIEDNMESIFTAIKEDALIGKVGGGVGFNISKLRPKGASISKGGESSGVMSFLEIFDSSAKAIHTGGGRRGAHIAILNVDHPEIEDFIEYKKGSENNRLTQFNISVGITNDFIQAVKNDEDWDLVFEGKVYKTIKAKDLYDKMTKHAWWYNEPGAIFLDTVEKDNNGHHAFKVDRCNPCGEIVMPSYSLCCLSSINLSKLVQNSFSENSSFNWKRFSEIVSIGIRFLDNVLDVTDYPLEKIEEISKSWRRIGLGITGLADAMIKLKIKYGSKESIDFVNKLGYHLSHESYKSSIELAKEKGGFPAFDENIGDYGFILKLDKNLQQDIKKYGLRNIGLNTIAPTGTTSLTFGNNCSSGIEPIFALSYNRRVKQEDGTDKTDKVYDDGWLEYLKYKKEQKIDEIPEYITTSHSIDIKDSILVQSTFQYWIDHSISKTINLPYETTLEKYRDIFMFAWEHNLKGITSFHEGASMEGVLSTNSNKEQIRLHAKKRPKELPCEIYEMSVNKKRVIALVGLLDNLPYEVFLTDDPDEIISVKHARDGFIEKVKTGVYDLHIPGKRGEYILHDISSVFDTEWGTLGRLTSMSLRHNVPLQFIVDQLNKEKLFGTFSKGMARVLKKYIKDEEKVLGGKKCPECGSELVFKEGCKSCPQCGWSRC